MNLFDDGCCDVRYLDEWNTVPLNYKLGQATDASWHVDRYQEFIARDENGELFHRAADLLMRYRFYPPIVMSHVADFDLEDRWLRVGDRIIQRIHLFHLFGRSVLDVVGMTEVRSITDEPHRYGFTYVTAATHVEQGQWSARVEWHQSGDVVLTVHAISRPSPQEPSRNHAFIRDFQKKSHQLGLNHFKQSVLS
jgi:hypothetical protein